MNNLLSVQEWTQIDEILEKGVIKLKNKSFVKIIKIIPINYNLKSELEKEAILNSYKLFLKICNFDFQILIQSSKEDLNQIISQINNQSKKNKKTKEISESYIKYIKKLNYEQKSAAKNFYIIIKEKNKENIIENLEEKYLKIKENIFRCGNSAEEIKSKEEVKEILISFFNKRIQEKMN